MTPILPYCVEDANVYKYSKGNCMKCDLPLECFNDSVHVGLLKDNNQENNERSWFHLKCFFKVRRPISVDLIDGYANLQYSHQMRIQKYIREDTTSIYDLWKIYLDDQPEDESDESILESNYREQCEEFYHLIRKIQLLSLSIDEYREVLTEQKQFVPEKDEEVIFHLADVIFFGALPPCEICHDGKMVFKNSSYICTGYDSPWTKCSYSTKLPKRFIFKLPNEFERAFGPSNCCERIIRDVSFEYDPDDIQLHIKQPLFNMEFYIFGEIKDLHTNIENKIRSMGGRVATNVHENITAIITNNKFDSMNPDQNIRKASEYKIQVIPERFLDKVLYTDPLKLIDEMSLCKWGDDSSPRLKDEINIPSENNQPEEHVKKYRKCDTIKDFEANGIVWHNNYNVVLTLVDIAYNKNLFIKLQLNTKGEGNGFEVYQSKGRIGEKGVTSRTSFNELPKAQSEFEKLYETFTGNKLFAINFVKNPGMYYQIKIENRVEKVPKNEVPTTLNQSLYELMRLLYSKENLLQKTLQKYCINSNTMPLGKICQQGIQNALNVLDELSNAMENVNNSNRLIALSNQFYSYFPQNFGHYRPPIINTHKMIEDRKNVLTQLLKNGIYYKILDKNPFDICYDRLDDTTEISKLCKTTGMHRLICKYVENTRIEPNSGINHPIDVEEIFEVCRHVEKVQFKSHETNFNRQLLFYETPNHNFTNILRNGLRIGMHPLESFLNKYRNGNGIYFSDSILTPIERSEHYTGTVLVLLCEVAVGRTDNRILNTDNSTLLNHCESIQVIGKNYPHPMQQFEDGLLIPNGRLKQRENHVELKSRFNQFVVFNESRIKIRYVLKLNLRTN